MAVWFFVWFLLGGLAILTTAIFFSLRRAFLLAVIWVLPMAIPHAMHDMSSHPATRKH
jgi:hypothetical protein